MEDVTPGGAPLPQSPPFLETLFRDRSYCPCAAVVPLMSVSAAVPGAKTLPEGGGETEQSRAIYLVHCSA